MVRRTVGSIIGAVGAGVGSAVCCSGPLVATAMGLSGAGLVAFRPYRPIFVLVAVGFLWAGFYLVDREDQQACEPGKLCASPIVRKRLRVLLWVATALVFLFGTSVRWLPWIL